MRLREFNTHKQDRAPRLLSSRPRTLFQSNNPGGYGQLRTETKYRYEYHQDGEGPGMIFPVELCMFSGG